jgi:phosphate transport system protein
MATATPSAEVFQSALVNYLVAMARQVEGAVGRGMESLLQADRARAAALASEIFLNEPRINEMELVIDEHAIRMLRGHAGAGLPDADIRQIVSTLRINNDLERMGDLAVNIGQRVITLGQMEEAAPPEEFRPMSAAVRAMVNKCLGALIFRNVDLANEVLESDDAVDHYRDLITERLLTQMTRDPGSIAPGMQFVLAARYLERIADHATNIAEEVVFWIRGLDVRHGRGLEFAEQERERSRAGGQASGE